MPLTPMLGEYQTFLASAARTATGTGTAFDTADWDIITAQVNITAVAGVTPTLVVRIQTTYDDGATWIDIAVTSVAASTVSRLILSTTPPGTLTDRTPTAFTGEDGGLTIAALPKAIALGTQCRFQWTITGSAGQSFTFAVTGVVRRLAA